MHLPQEREDDGADIPLDSEMTMESINQYSKSFFVFYLGHNLATVKIFRNVLMIEMLSMQIEPDEVTYSTAVKATTRIAPIISAAMAKGLMSIVEWDYDFDRDQAVEHFKSAIKDSNDGVALHI